MRRANTIEDDIRELLDVLHRDAVHARQRGEEPQEIEGRLATFEMNLHDRLFDARHDELAGSKAAIGPAVQVFAHRQRLDTYQRESALVPFMTPEQQVRLWNSLSHLVMTEHDQTKLESDISAAASKAICTKYDSLTNAVEQAVQEIAQGHEPSLNEILAGLTAKQPAQTKTMQNEKLLALVNDELEKQRGNERER